MENRPYVKPIGIQNPLQQIIQTICFSTVFVSFILALLELITSETFGKVLLYCGLGGYFVHWAAGNFGRILHFAFFGTFMVIDKTYEVVCELARAIFQDNKWIWQARTELLESIVRVGVVLFAVLVVINGLIPAIQSCSQSVRWCSDLGSSLEFNALIGTLVFLGFVYAIAAFFEKRFSQKPVLYASLSAVILSGMLLYIVVFLERSYALPNDTTLILTVAVAALCLGYVAAINKKHAQPAYSERAQESRSNQGHQRQGHERQNERQEAPNTGGGFDYSKDRFAKSRFDSERHKNKYQAADMGANDVNTPENEAMQFLKFKRRADEGKIKGIKPLKSD